MVMEAVPSPQCVGREFVRQYYTLLNKAPLHLHRFYSQDSSFVHGGLKEGMAEEVHGQQQIHEKIMELDFHDCKAKILLVDSHRTLENGVVVQVAGELSNKGQPMRRFVQTFVLAPQSAKKYYVRNDIFRYQDDIEFDDEDVHEERSAVENDDALQRSSTAAAELNQERTSSAAIALTVPYSNLPATVDAAVANHAAPAVNGTDHAEHDARSVVSTPYTTPAPAQPEPPAPTVPVVVPAAATPSPPPAAPSPPPPQTAEVVPDIVVPEPEKVVADIPVPKPVVEPVSVAPAAPPEPKTFANLFKTPTSFNGPTPATGVPTNLPPFGAARSAPAPAAAPAAVAAAAPAQTSEPSPAPAAVNGSEAYPPAMPAQQQRNNFRAPRPPMGNGRVAGNPVGPGVVSNAAPPMAASGPGSYNRERDQDRVEKERAPSRHSTEEMGEWKQQNGDANRERDREFRRYDDNVQVFVGNIPHSATEDNLRDLFQQFGTVVDVRIQGSGLRIQNGGRAPYYGFIVFDVPEAAEAALNKKPLLLNGDHRLNVEQKRRGGTNPTGGPRGGYIGNRGGGMGMANRGGRIGGGPMGMGPRDGGRGGGMTGGRGGYTNRPR